MTQVLFLFGGLKSDVLPATGGFFSKGQDPFLDLAIPEFNGQVTVQILGLDFPYPEPEFFWQGWCDECLVAGCHGVFLTVP